MLYNKLTVTTHPNKKSPIESKTTQTSCFNSTTRASPNLHVTTRQSECSVQKQENNLKKKKTKYSSKLHFSENSWNYRFTLMIARIQITLNSLRYMPRLFSLRMRSFKLVLCQDFRLLQHLRKNRFQHLLNLDSILLTSKQKHSSSPLHQLSHTVRIILNKDLFYGIL